MVKSNTNLVRYCLSSYNVKLFCNYLVTSVRIATTLWEDVDGLYGHQRISIWGSLSRLCQGGMTYVHILLHTTELCQSGYGTLDLYMKPSKIMLRMVHGSDNCTGYEGATGQTPDISEWLDFQSYDFVWWLNCPMKPNITDPPWHFACWLGVSHRVSSDLCCWLITDTGKLISKSSVKHVICDNYLNVDKK